MRNIIAPFLLSALATFSLLSCEDTKQSQVEIKISPETPVAGNFEFEGGDETVTPNWIVFSLNFSNSTDQRLIIDKVEYGYRYGSQKTFSDLSELDPADLQAQDYFLDVDAGSSGEEFQFINNAPSFVRYIFDLEKQGNPDALNYYFKMVFTGYFTADNSSDNPLPSEGFTQTIYFRTKSYKSEL